MSSSLVQLNSFIKRCKMLLLVIALGYHVGSAKPAIDSLLTVAQTAKDTMLIDALNQLAYEYKSIDIELVLVYADSAIALSKKIGYVKGIGNAYLNKGHYFKVIGNHNAAKACYVWAGIQHNHIGSKKGVSAAFNGIASLAYLKGNLTIALTYFLKSLALSEEVNDQKGVGMTLNNIGVINLEQGNSAKALKYYQKAYDTFKQIGDENNVADALNNIGNIYNTRGENDEALNYYKQALAINTKIGDLKDESVIINNIGIIHFDRKQYKEALSCYLQSLNIDEKLKDQQALSVTCNNISNCYFHMKMLYAAKKYADRAFEISSVQQYKSDIVTSLNMLYKITDALGDYKEALSYYKLYKTYSDSLFNQETKAQLETIEKQYETQKAENERLLKTLQTTTPNQQASATVQQEMKESIQVVALVLIGFIVVVYLVFFIARNNS
ncbi:MAG: tetratricopeptide repeat protein [Bacteroidetes bacterium]|nr:MAG: tetratricopeptide repeat protein [Bacteroidota bacterium]